jgi:heme-degrading monooxygenase HmoA
MEAAVHDRVPAVGRLGYMAVAPGLDEATAATWARRFSSMLASVPGLAQAFLLRALQGNERIALTFWVSPEAMEAGGAAIGAWHAAEIAEGRPPATVATKTVVLTDLRFLLAGVPTTAPR